MCVLWFGDKRAGCQGAHAQLMWTVRVRSVCSGARGHIVGEDEFVHDADGVQAIDAACVVNDVMCVSPLRKLFAKTREAVLLMFMHVLWSVTMPSCGAVMFCGRGCDVGVNCGMLCV